MVNIKKLKTPSSFTQYTVKRFRDAQAMHEFLNKQTHNDWIISPELDGLCGGTYTMLPNRAPINNKTLDASFLAHCK